jgi:hypothetical protein
MYPTLPSTAARPPVVTYLNSGDRTYTSVRIAPSHSGLHKSIRNPHTLSGWRVTAAGVEPWRWNGTVEHKNWLYLTFPEITENLYPCSDIFRMDLKDTLRLLEHFFSTLQQLSEQENFDPDALYLCASFFDEEGNLYILHPQIAQFTQQNFEQLCPVPDKDATGPVGRRELVPVSAYLLQLNILNIQTQEKQAQLNETQVKSHLHTVFPELHPRIAAFLFHTINRQSTVGSAREDLRAASEELAAWRKTDIVENIHIDTAEERRSQAVSLEKSLRKREKLRALRKRHGSTAILTITALVVIGFFAAPFVQRAFEPDITEGLSPSEVIELFYTSQNSLNHEAMAECTTRSIGNSHINQVTTLFVIARVRQGVEMKDVFTPAPDWIESGKPELQDSSFVFGITDLNIRKTEEANQFEVSYIKWSTLPPEAEKLSSENEQAKISSTGQVQAFRINEHLHMIQSSKGWKIDRIEVQQEQPYRFRTQS